MADNDSKPTKSLVDVHHEVEIQEVERNLEHLREQEKEASEQLAKARAK